MKILWSRLQPGLRIGIECVFLEKIENRNRFVSIFSESEPFFLESNLKSVLKIIENRNRIFFSSFFQTLIKTSKKNKTQRIF